MRSIITFSPWTIVQSVTKSLDTFFFFLNHQFITWGAVMPYKSLGKISDILHSNSQNNQLEKRAWPP